MASLFEELAGLIGDQQVLVVVGAGVSIGATRNAATASWTGLLEHGVGWVEDRVAGLPDGWGKRVRDQIASGDVTELLSAAENITARLGGSEGGRFRGWLRDAIQPLEPVDTQVVEALGALGVPIATTNYDGLLEQVLGLQPVTWRDGDRARRALRQDTGEVLHLHGYWNDPASVVLGIRSYEQVMGDGPAQALQQALATMRSLLLVGFGAGLDDPNFGALRAWMGQLWSGSEYAHYRLALDAEVEQAAAVHDPAERVEIIGYGPEHDDLAGFLTRLADAAGTARGTGGAAGSTTRPDAPSPTALPGRPLCLGRDDQLAGLAATLAGGGGPVVVLGGPGMGKSTLCLAALHDPTVAETFGDRRWFVRCDPATDASGLVAEIARTVGASGGADLEAAVVAVLRQGAGVMVLDNLETPWTDDVLATEQLLGRLATVDGVTLVGAVRGAERPQGPAWTPITVTPLDHDTARRLFVTVAGDRFANDPQLDQLVAKLDGVPLAVQLLANAAEPEPDLAGLTRRWTAERTGMLQRSGGGHRLLSLAVSLELSIDGPRMTRDGRRLLAVLSALPDGVAHEDLSVVAPGWGDAAATVLRRTGLGFDETGRLRLLAPVREHVHAHHPPAQADLQPAVDHYLALASTGMQIGWEGGNDVAGRLAADAGNIETLLTHALATHDPTAAIDAADAYGKFLEFRGGRAPDVLHTAADAADRVDDHLRHAHCILRLGDIALRRSDHDTARNHFQQATGLYRQVDDVAGQANCIFALGVIALVRSDHDTARNHFQQATKLYRQVDDVLGEANCIFRLGVIALERSDHDTARNHFQQATGLYRQVGDVLGQANCIQSLGDIALARSDHDTAHDHYQQATKLYRQVGDVLGEANCIQRLGVIALERSDHDTARNHFQQATGLYHQVGAVLGEANCILRLGDIAVEESDLDAAQEAFGQALGLYESIEEPYSIGQAHRRLAHIAEDTTVRCRHARQAAASWQTIDRDDLATQARDEFPDCFDTA